MPRRSRYDELQLALAILLIQVYYKKDPLKFAFIIKQTVLKETNQTFIRGENVSLLNTLLRGNTVAKYLFQFGIFCYAKEGFLTFLKSDIADEFSFFTEQKAKAKAQFDKIIDGAYWLYAINGDSGVVADELLPNIELDDATLQRGIEVSEELYALEVQRQIERDLAEVFAVIAPGNMSEINAGKQVTLSIDGEEYSLGKHKARVRVAKETGYLLERSDGEMSSRCCGNRCCSMM